MSLPLREVKEKLEGSDLEIKFEKHRDPDETREFFLRVGGQATIVEVYSEGSKTVLHYSSF